MSITLDLMAGNTIQQVTANTDYLTCLPPPESAKFVPDRIHLDPPNHFAKWDLNTKGEKTKYGKYCRVKGCNSKSYCVKCWVYLCYQSKPCFYKWHTGNKYRVQ